MGRKKINDNDILPRSSVKRTRSDSPPIHCASPSKKGKFKADNNEGVRQVLEGFEDEMTCPMYVLS